MKALDLGGQRFGRGVVLRPDGQKGRGKRRANNWRLRCDCGKEYEAITADLRSGDVQSCGCLNHDRRSQRALSRMIPARMKPPGVAAMNDYLREYKANASKRRHKWDLSPTEFEDIVRSSCHWCGELPSRLRYATEGRSPRETPVLVNGVDRLDASLGYTAENCVPCCARCNLGKNVSGPDEFLSWVARVHRHSLRGEIE